MKEDFRINEKCREAIQDFDKIKNEIVWLKNYTSLFDSITIRKEEDFQIKDFIQLGETHSYISDFFNLFKKTQDTIPPPF